MSVSTARNRWVLVSKSELLAQPAHKRPRIFRADARERRATISLNLDTARGMTRRGCGRISGVFAPPRERLENLDLSAQVHGDTVR